MRELENIIERAVVMTQNTMLDENDFAEITEKLASMNLPISKVSEDTTTELSAGLYSMPNLDAIDGRALEVVVGEVEARLIQYALKNSVTQKHVLQSFSALTATL